MVHELDDLPAGLQPGQVAVQLDTVQAFQIQPHVAIQHIADRDRHRPRDPRRHGTLRNVAYPRMMRQV